MLDPRRVRAILFDLDGTLADTDDALVRRLASILRPLRSMRKDWDEAFYARRIIMAFETPSNAILSILDRLSLDEVIRPILNGAHRLRGEALPEEASLIPGVQKMLVELAAHYPLAIVTAREKRSAEQLLEALDIESTFQHVATAGTCRRSKPHPAPVLWAAAQLGIDPENCLMVGDTTVDIRAGCAAGAQTIGVLCGFGQRDELLRAGAHQILYSTADLPIELLKHTNGESTLRR